MPATVIWLAVMTTLFRATSFFFILCACGDATPVVSVDAEAPDASIPDTSVPDTSVPDTSIPDVSVPDTTAPDAACGKPGNEALSFAGAQYAAGPDSPSMRPTDLTVEAWVSFDSVPQMNPTVVIAKPYGSGTADSFVIWYQAGSLNAGIDPTSPQDALGYVWAPTLGKWYHVALTFESSTKSQKLYLDGALIASGTAASTPTYDTHGLYVGADVDYNVTSDYLQGKVDEVRVWSVARTVQEIASDLQTCTTGKTAGLEGYWPFDEGTGQTAADTSGNGNGMALGMSPGPDSADPSWVPSTVPF